MTNLRDRVRCALESQRAPWFILAATLVVALPSIQLEFYNDDHALRAALEGTWPGGGPPLWDLYRFATGDPAQNRASVEIGALPWWTAPGLKLHLVRPLTSLLFALDHAVFRDASLGYHLHSIAWYLVLVAAAGALLRSVLSRASAHLAMLLFGISAAHFFPYAWISCRHMLLAAVPVTLGLVALVRDGRRGPWLFALGLSLGLSASEAALAGSAFPLAYCALAREGTRWERVRALLPTLAVSCLYLLLYSLAGGGAAQSDGYVDPVSAPGRFATKALSLFPVMIGNAIFGVPAEFASIASRLPLVLVGIGAAIFAAWLARACRAELDPAERKALPWLVCGAILALVPALGGFPGARTLLLPNLGFAALIAVLIRRGLGARFLPRLAAGLLVLLHLVLSPLSDVGNASFNARIGREAMAIAATAEIGPDHPRAFVIGASDPMVTVYAATIIASTSPGRLSCWSLLSAAKRAHRLTRVGASELVVRPVTGSLLLEPFEALYRSADLPIRVGEEFRQCGASYRVSAVQEGRPTEVHVSFDRALEDPSLCLLVWKDGRLRRMPLPAPGETREIGWEKGPLGFF